jgi:hypothetical protein
VSESETKQGEGPKRTQKNILINSKRWPRQRLLTYKAMHMYVGNRSMQRHMLYVQRMLLCVHVKDSSGGVRLLVACMTFWPTVWLQILLQLRQDIICFFFSFPLSVILLAHTNLLFLLFCLSFVSIFSSPLQQALAN